MFTDIVGYTALTHSDEAQALGVLDRHNRLLKPFFPKFKGREIKTMGDSFLVEFESSLDAINCAIEIQKFLHDYNISSREEWKINLRIGIHLGDVVHKGGDVFGDAVNIASRIQPLADPEGVCISQQVFDQIQNKIDYPLEQLEHSQLRNVKLPIAVYKVLLHEQNHREYDERTIQVDKKHRRIAVLPFTNISPDSRDEYFADGMTEELISTLSKIRELRVISRTSVMRYKQANKNTADIARELNVGSILEGSVRKAGDDLRITVQLIDVQRDEHLWSDDYERKMDNVFAVQKDIAQRVAQSLKINLISEEKEEIGKRPTQSIEAYNLYMRGRLYVHRSTLDSLSSAIRYFSEAIQKDPKFGEAYAGIARCYGFLGFYELSPPKEAFPKAKMFAEKALELDDSIAEAHASLGLVLHAFEWKYTVAEREYRRAIELNPNLAFGHLALANLLSSFRRNDEVVSEAKLAIELDPLSAATLALGGTMLLYGRRYDEAIEVLKNAIEIDSKSTLAQENLGLAYVQKGVFDIGISEIKKAEDLEGDAFLYKNDLAYAYSRAGRKDEVEKILSELLELKEKGQESATAIAGVYASLGNKDKAFDWLQKAYEEHSGYLTQIADDFSFAPLWTDPRFVELLKKIGLGDVTVKNEEST